MFHSSGSENNTCQIEQMTGNLNNSICKRLEATCADTVYLDHILAMSKES
jgi:hypothetical protein